TPLTSARFATRSSPTSTLPSVEPLGPTSSDTSLLLASSPHPFSRLTKLLQLPRQSSTSRPSGGGCSSQSISQRPLCPDCKYCHLSHNVEHTATHFRVHPPHTT